MSINPGGGSVPGLNTGSELCADVALIAWAAGAAATSRHAAPPVAPPLIRPQLAKRAAYAVAQQTHPRLLARTRATVTPASFSRDVTAASSIASASGPMLPADGKAAQQLPQLSAKPSLAKRKQAAALSPTMTGDAAASLATSGEAGQVAAESTAAPQLPNKPSMAVRPSIAKRKTLAAKPVAAKRPVDGSKAPMLMTIAEIDPSPPVPPTSAVPLPPTNLITATAPGGPPSSSQVGASAEKDTCCQPHAPAKPATRQRTKAADLDAAAVHAKVIQKHAEGTLAELTVPEAKCWLKGRKLPLKGKKENLVARIIEALLPP